MQRPQKRGRRSKNVVVGGERASIQDLETSIRQLVEVALRALSPSISDPFTAMAVVDRLTESPRSYGAVLLNGCGWMKTRPCGS